VGIVRANVISRAWSPESWQTPSGVARSARIIVAGAGVQPAAGVFAGDLAPYTQMNEGAIKGLKPRWDFAGGFEGVTFL
jgi:hypothetical protein